MPAFAGTFYVRPDGNNSNSGTANTPQGAWATIQKAADTVNPSDLVEVQPGTYNEQVTITRSGLANQLITFHGAGGAIDGQNTRPYCIKLDGADYIRIDGFTVRNATDNGILLDNSADSNIILWNNCYNNGASGIRLTNTSNHNIVAVNTCHSNGAGTSAYGDRPCGIYLFNSSNYNTLADNTCRNNTSTGIWLEGSSSYCTVKNNKTYSNGWGGIIVAGGTNYNAVSYNLIYSNGAMGVDLSYSAHDNVFTNNTIYNNGSNGIQSNNTGYSNVLKNNIIVNNGLNNSYVSGISIEAGSSIVSTYNDVYNNGQGGIKNYSGLSAGPGDICLDPLFKSIDPLSWYFLRLQRLAGSDPNESPCIDSGSPSDTPSSQSGKRVDIGAYDEYQHAPIQGGLFGEYFDNMDFTALKVSRVDPRINFDWGSYSPDASIGVDTFSVRWRGQIKIDFAQAYTFYLVTDDGSRLYIDNQLIIDKWFNQAPTEYSVTITLTPGLHDIRYEYYDNTGWAVAKLYWSSPSINKTIIPQDHFYYFDRLPQGQYSQGGLKGIYSKYTNLYGPTSYVLTRIDPQINFDWGYNMPDSALGQDLYQAKWKGKVRIDTANTYTFYATSDDGSRLWVNNQVLIDAWQNQGATERQGSIYLAPGLYDIELDYFDNTNLAVCKLLWSSSTITKQVIPPTSLYYKNDDSSDGGLLAEYYDNPDFTNLKIKRIDPNIDFDWQASSPDPLIQADTFSIRWTGQVKADYGETYTFFAASDDGLKLWVDNQLLISAWWNHGAQEFSASINLTAGWHDIKVEYYEDSGLSAAKLSYSSASTPKTIIPQDHLRTTLSTEDASLNLRCSLNNTADVQTPATGHSGSIIQTGTGVVNFDWAKFGKGAILSGSSDGNNRELVEFSSSDLNRKEGEIEFWFKPTWNSDDGVWHHLFSTNWTWDGTIEIFKYSNNSLYFKIVKDGVQHAIVSDTSRKWNANTWHHLAFSYGPAGMKFYLDYNQIPVSWIFNGEPAYTGTLPDTFISGIYIGGGGQGGVTSDATFDELKIYNKQITPSDTTAPVFTITSHRDNQTVNSSPVTIAGTIDDNLSQVTVNSSVQASVSNGTFSASIPLSLGPNTITVSATDQSNNNSTLSINLIFADITPPTTSTVTDDGAYTVSNAQLHASWTACSDPESGINRYEYAIGTTQGGTDVVGWTSVGLNTEVTKTGLALTEGQIYYFSVAAINNANLSSVGYSNGIIVDTTPPSGTIIINGGAQYTNSTAVTLTLSATDAVSGVSQMRFSNDNTTWSTPEAYATSKSWPLSAGDGTKTVYVKFRDAAGNWSNAVSATITLDTTPPSGTVIINGGDQYTNSREVSLTLPATDTGTGVTKMKFSDDGITWPYPSVDYQTPYPWTLTTPGDGEKAVFVKFIDVANNESEPAASDTIILDTVPPAPTINSVTSPTDIDSQIITGTKEDAATIEVTCLKATVGTVSYPTNTTWSCPLTLSEGTNDITVIAKNSAGTPSPPATTSILLDTTAPSGTVTINNDAQYAKSPDVILNLSATDGAGSGVAKMQFSNTNNENDWSDPEDYATSKSWTLITGNGTRIVYARFIDGVGKVSASATDTITLDTVFPVVSIVTPEDGFTALSQPITVTGTIDDNQATVAITVNNGPPYTTTVSSGFFSAGNITLDQGQNTITATATDPAGNASTGSVTVTYQPNVPLSISILTPTDGASVSTSTIDVTGTVTGNGASVTVNGIPATVSNNVFTALNVPLTEGPNTVIAQATSDTQPPVTDSRSVTLSAAGSGWQIIQNTYDCRDCLVKTTEYLNGSPPIVTTFEYDYVGNKTKQTDPNGHSTTYAYDERSLLLSTTDAEGNTTENTYYQNGKLHTVKDARTDSTDITTYEYDDSGWFTKATYPDNSYEQYTPDDNSNIATKRTRRGELITYSYDALNRMTSKACDSYPTVTYTYDIASCLTTVTDGSYSISYSYDALNRTTQVTYPGLRTVSYQYDTASNRTKLTYPDNTYITYEYDQLNRLKCIKDPNSQVVSQYTYDSLSRRLSADYQNNTQATYLYDDVNRLKNKINKQTSGPVISSFSYTYDNASNRLTMTTTQGTHNYGYDNINQIKNVTYPAGSPFSGGTYYYDGVGNRTQLTGGVVEAYTSNNLNQYTQINATSYSYDGNGNLTNYGVFTYAYDYENRLTSATTSTMTALYTYDPAGRRIEKSVNGYITCYIYDGNQIIAEYDGTGSLARKFVYGPGIDEPILMDNITNKYYYHFDGLGSVTEISDSSANIVEKYFYDIFGSVIIKDASDNILTQSAVGNPYFFTARALDPETGLYYYRARYYNPLIGRFLQTDPVGYSAGMNLYAYCDNDPINQTDPMGLCTKEKLKSALEEALKETNTVLTSAEFDAVLSALEKAAEKGALVQSRNPVTGFPIPGHHLEFKLKGLGGLAAKLAKPLAILGTGIELKQIWSGEGSAGKKLLKSTTVISANTLTFIGAGAAVVGLTSTGVGVVATGGAVVIIGAAGDSVKSSINNNIDRNMY